jgi:quinol monooxygenase YgiN
MGATLSKDLYNVLVRYTTSPEHIDSLIALLKENSRIFQRMPGFVSLTMHKAQDKKQVLVYLQWRSQTDSDACMTHPIWQTEGADLYQNFIIPGKATMEPAPFDIVQELSA